MDWDRVRVFHAVALAGSFTRAADGLSLSQSAISRQVSALEEHVGAPLFHRHARGLVLTEQGEILFETASDMARRMAIVDAALQSTQEQPAGHLRINTTIGVGTVWLTGHLAEFMSLHPHITVSMIATDYDLDLGMREADVAVRLQRPTQSDLIQKRLMTGNTHVYAARSYIERFGEPSSPSALASHRLIAYGPLKDIPTPSLNWVLEVGGDGERRRPALEINNVYGMLRACETGLGIASLPDYLTGDSESLKRILPEINGPTFTAYFVYPEELRANKRVAVFRDFLLQKVKQHPIW